MMTGPDFKNCEKFIIQIDDRKETGMWNYYTTHQVELTSRPKDLKHLNKQKNSI